MRLLKKPCTLTIGGWNQSWEADTTNLFWEFSFEMGVENSRPLIHTNE